MAWKEKIKEFGKDVLAETLGRGPERKFEKDVALHARTHGVSREESERDIFFERTGNVRDAIGLDGFVHKKSKDWEGFDAALKVLFTKDELKDFRTESNDPAIFHMPLVHPVDLRWQARVRGHFQTNFEGRSPEVPVIRNYTEQNSLLWSLLHRLEADSRLHGLRLKDAVRLNPEIAADIGKMLEAHGMISYHEEKFEKKLAFEKSHDRLKNTARESLAKMFFGVPVEWLKVVSRHALRPSFEGFFKMISATIIAMGKEGYYAGKLLSHAGIAGYRYIRK